MSIQQVGDKKALLTRIRLLRQELLGKEGSFCLCKTYLPNSLNYWMPGLEQRSDMEFWVIGREARHSRRILNNRSEATVRRAKRV